MQTQQSAVNMCNKMDAYLKPLVRTVCYYVRALVSLHSDLK